MRSSRVMPLWVWLCGWPLLSCDAPAADPARLIPHDAAVCVELSDPVRLVDRLLGPNIMNMLDSIQPYRQFKRSDQFARFRAVVRYVETRLDRTWRQAIHDLAGGGVLFAIRPGDPDYVLLLVRARTPELLEQTNRLLIEITENEATKQGRASPVKSIEYKGVTVWSLGKQEYHAIIGDTLVISNHRQGLKTVLEMNAGEGPEPISSTEAWQAARRRMSAAHVGWALVKLEPLRQAGVAKELYAEKAPHPGIPLLFAGLPNVLRSSAYLTGRFTLDDRRLGLRVELPRDEQSWPEALRGFYAQQAGMEAAEPLRPAGTIASLSFYRDLKAIWDSREQLVTPEVLPNLTQLETQVAQILFSGREFASEVLGELEPHIRVVVAVQDYARAGVDPQIKIPAFALVLELKHPKEFEEDLLIGYQTVLGFVNVGLGQQNQPRFVQRVEPYHGHRIHTARFQNRSSSKAVQAGGHLRQNFSPSFTIAGRYYVLGSTAQIVQDIIDVLGDTSAPPKTTPHNIVLEANTEQLIRVLVQNNEALVSQNMVQNGNTRQQAEQEVGILLKLLGLFGEGKLSWTAEPESVHVDLTVEFGVE